jgi:hypothetical protein
MLHTDLNSELFTGEFFREEEICDMNEYEECRYFKVPNDQDFFYEAGDRDYDKAESGELHNQGRC